MTETSGALGWDDEIENDGEPMGDFVTLPAGEYPFEVTDFERERHTPNPANTNPNKLPACNKAVITLAIDGGELGVATVKENLFLHERTEGILCAFFTSIGQRQHGQKIAMDWSKVKGATGRVKVKVREYEKDGEKRTINDVKAWLEPDTTEAPAKAFSGSL